MSLFKGMKDAKLTERGNYLDDGSYDLEIEFVQLKNTRKAGDAFIVDCTVLASSNPKHPVGSKRNWYQSLKDKDIAFAAILEFAIAVFGFSQKKIEDEPKIKELQAGIEEIMDQACDKAKQVLKGQKLHVEVETIKTKEKGLPFARHKFTPYEAPKTAAA